MLCVTFGKTHTFILEGCGHLPCHSRENVFHRFRITFLYSALFLIITVQNKFMLIEGSWKRWPTQSDKVIYWPINLFVNEKQDFVAGLVVEDCIDFLHFSWQTEHAETLGISLCHIIAIESPDLRTWGTTFSNYISCLIWQLSSLLKINILYLHLWFHEEPLTYMHSWSYHKRTISGSQKNLSGNSFFPISFLVWKTL